MPSIVFEADTRLQMKRKVTNRKAKKRQKEKGRRRRKRRRRRRDSPRRPPCRSPLRNSGAYAENGDADRPVRSSLSIGNELRISVSKV
jgi:sRNA-binding protein